LERLSRCGRDLIATERSMDMPQRPTPHRRDEDERGDVPAQRVQGGLDPDAWVQTPAQPHPQPTARPAEPRPYEPPISALAPLFRQRLERIYACRVRFTLDINTRPTIHVLGGYYKSRRLVRLYTHDRKDGRRPLNELFETFLHEVAHHIEYTEPQSFDSRVCRRVPGRMHSRLFWQILGELKYRWAELQARHRAQSQARPG
jgi:hypothetical protein